MSTPSYPEILHSLALEAAEHEVSLRKGVENSLRREGWLAHDARKKATELLPYVRTSLNDHLRSFPGRHIEEYYQQDPTNPDLLIPIAGCGKNKWTAYIQSRIIVLPARDFELLVGNTFVSIECTQVAVTPMTGDGGCDFVGKLDLSLEMSKLRGFTGPSALEGQCDFLFGEAKRYKLSNPVEVGDVDKLIGSVHTLTEGGGTPTKDKIIDALDEWGWVHGSPIRYLFATTGRFRTPIRGLARRHKCFVIDGEQLSQRIIYLYPTIDSREQADTVVNDLTKNMKPNVSLL